MIPGENRLKLKHVRRNFSWHADEYERYALVQKVVVPQLLRHLSPGAVWQRVLEVGCGTGMLSRKFMKDHPDTKLILSDLAHDMSRRVACEFPFLPVVDADAENLPFRDTSFDLVLSSSVYQWVNHLMQAFAELGRILSPGGKVAMALFGERTLHELRHSHATALSAGKSHSQGFPTISQVRGAVGDHFTVEYLESQLEVEWHPGVPHLLRSLKAIGAQNASRDRPSGLTSRRMMQRMYDCYSEKFGREGTIPATYEVIYLVLKKCG
ncbi:malonyl-ACP O-methyltransferase BioC [Geopsychrobacter electrodiphilus]|uniref:malonyl-ACP O-methyltransferase BioC n=1 Tax=Geopsychrobacter electrodiphilus TaxID=225196 RepID=UPI00037BF29D|nr:malonyl-ACP O-methyltransferase BioC [Geopsychrobacter electrodiphilus]